jgi:hypothetical protein
VTHTTAAGSEAADVGSTGTTRADGVPNAEDPDDDHPDESPDGAGRAETRALRPRAAKTTRGRERVTPASARGTFPPMDRRAE